MPFVTIETGNSYYIVIKLLVGSLETKLLGNVYCFRAETHTNLEFLIIFFLYDFINMTSFLFLFFAIMIKKEEIISLYHSGLDVNLREYKSHNSPDRLVAERSYI